MRKLALVLLSLALIAGNHVYGQKNNKKIVVSGVVKDINNQPVVGAMILVDDKNTNVVTDEKGLFRAKIKPSAKVISAFSYTSGSGKAAIDSTLIVNITLDGTFTSKSESPAKQDGAEKVNIGYGTNDKKNLTSKAENINPQENKYASYRSIYDILSEVPGVQVSGSRVVIRGASSINSGTDPLFVVDGSVVSSIDHISPRDVKRISVLKGADAAIYGVRGANGVILIDLVGARK